MRKEDGWMAPPPYFLAFFAAFFGVFLAGFFTAFFAGFLAAFFAAFFAGFFAAFFFAAILRSPGKDVRGRRSPGRTRAPTSRK